MAYMLQTDASRQRNAPFVPVALDFLALCVTPITVRLTWSHRRPLTLDWDVSSLRHLVAYASV